MCCLKFLPTSLMGVIALKASSKHKGLFSNDSGKIQRRIQMSPLFLEILRAIGKAV